MEKALIFNPFFQYMTELPWNTQIMDWFISIRVDWLTNIFLFFTFFGNEMGYILLIVLIYWLYDKRLAIQVVLVVLGSALINHILKILIANPRPFVTDGTYEDNWAVADADVEDTLHSYSTPSFHAQGGMTFWLYLHLKAKSRLTFVLLPIMVFFIGISRPYLGVHFLEDILLGWLLGFIIIVFAYRYDTLVSSWWNDLETATKYILAILPPLVLTFGAGFLLDFGVDAIQFATLSGMFSGLVLGVVLDQQYLSFDPDLSRYDSFVKKVLTVFLRLTIGFLLVGIFLLGLDLLFSLIAEDETFVGFLLRWIRYTGVGVAASFIAPYLFKRVNPSPMSST